MPALTVALGLVLIAIGVAGGMAAGQIHAYIPAFIGAVFLVLGAVAHNDRVRRHAMHGAAALALLSVLATFGGVIECVRWLTGTPPVIPRMAEAKCAVSLLCLVFEALCVKSFIDARRARSASG